MIQAELKELGKIELVNATERPLGIGEARIAVISCAICGSDIRIYNHGNSRITMLEISVVLAQIFLVMIQIVNIASLENLVHVTRIMR